MTNVNSGETAFDWIHDPIDVFRALMNAIARPGALGTIEAAADKLRLSAAGHHVELALAMSLLDAETTFAVRMKREDGLADAIARQTLCRQVEPSQADYLFIDGRFAESELNDLLSQIRKGTLVRPELGATLLVRVGRLAIAGLESGMRLRLTGPGIRERIECAIAGLSPDWLKERERLNAEYPLGSDLILYDAFGQVLGIPRTTQIEEV